MHNLTSGLDQIGNQLRLEGVKVVFHNHVGTYVETEAETARLLEETNPDYVGHPSCDRGSINSNSSC
jgi:inosose dehydratase